MANRVITNAASTGVRIDRERIGHHAVRSISRGPAARAAGCCEPGGSAWVPSLIGGRTRDADDQTRSLRIIAHFREPCSLRARATPLFVCLAVFACGGHDMPTLPSRHPDLEIKWLVPPPGQPGGPYFVCAYPAAELVDLHAGRIVYDQLNSIFCDDRIRVQVSATLFRLPSGRRVSTDRRSVVIAGVRSRWLCGDSTSARACPFLGEIEQTGRGIRYGVTLRSSFCWADEDDCFWWPFEDSWPD